MRADRGTAIVHQGVLPYVERLDPGCQRLQSACHIVSDEPCLSMSVGVAIYPVDGHDVETLLAKADKRMYHLKRQSKSEAGQKRAAADHIPSGPENDLLKLAQTQG